MIGCSLFSGVNHEQKSGSHPAKTDRRGVNNLKEFGYPSVSADNIMAGKLYPAFFDKMLEETVEEWSTPPSVRKVAQGLRDEIAALG